MQVAIYARDAAGKLIPISPRLMVRSVDDRRHDRKVVQRYETVEEAQAALRERGIPIDDIYEPLACQHQQT